MAAAIGTVQSRRLPTWTEQRISNAHYFNANLKHVQTPREAHGTTHVYHQYTVLTDRRDAIMAALTSAGIASAIYYPIPLHRQDVFADAFKGVSLPVAEETANRCMSLPIFPEMTDEQVREVVGVIKTVA